MLKDTKYGFNTQEIFTKKHKKNRLSIETASSILDHILTLKLNTEG